METSKRRLWHSPTTASRNDSVPKPTRSESNQNPRSLLAQNCLLIPVVAAFWWYWTRRTAKRAVTRYFLTSSNEHDENRRSNRTTMEYETFSTWEDVAGQEVTDSSVRLVRWIQANDSKRSVRQRAKVDETSRQTIRLASNPQLTDAILEENNDEERYVMSPQGSHWQYLKDITVDEIELCVVPQLTNSSFSGVSGKDTTSRPVFATNISKTLDSHCVIDDCTNEMEMITSA